MSGPIIQVEDVHVEYPVPGQPDRRVLNGIDLKIESGEFISIVGQTGCGKSTLLRLILGEQTSSRGRVLVNGRERWQPDRLCIPCRQRSLNMTHSSAVIAHPGRSALL